MKVVFKYCIFQEKSFVYSLLYLRVPPPSSSFAVLQNQNVRGKSFNTVHCFGIYLILRQIQALQFNILLYGVFLLVVVIFIIYIVQNYLSECNLSWK